MRARLAALALIPFACAPFLALGAGGAAGQPSAPLVYALLADDRVVAIGLDGKIQAERSLGGEPAPPTTSGDFLSISRAQQLLYALEPGGDQDRLIALSIPSLTIRAMYALDPAVQFRGLSVGPRTGELYLFGNRPRVRDAWHPSGAVVRLVDPDTGHVVGSWDAHKAAGRDWFVLEGAVSQDERELFLSYHGPNTSGLDWFSLSQGALGRCVRPRSSVRGPGDGCLPIHGRFVQDGKRFLGTTGEGPIVDIDRQGRVHRHWNMRLPGNHLMDFALDNRREYLYAVGPCGYTGGLSAVYLRTGTVRVLRRPAPSAICGDGTIVTPQSLAFAGFSGITFVDKGTGRVLHRTPVASGVLDLVLSATGASYSELHWRCVLGGEPETEQPAYPMRQPLCNAL